MTSHFLLLNIFLLKEKKVLKALWTVISWIKEVSAPGGFLFVLSLNAMQKKASPISKTDSIIYSRTDEMKRSKIFKELLFMQ